MRVMAMQKASEYEPIDAVLPLCVRALGDPCYDVRDEAANALVYHLDINDPQTGELMRPDLTWKGFRSHSRRRIYAIAKAARATRPDLFTSVRLERLRKKIPRTPETVHDR
jgi:hypothetical protein